MGAGGKIEKGWDGQIEPERKWDQRHCCTPHSIPLHRPDSTTQVHIGPNPNQFCTGCSLHWPSCMGICLCWMGHPKYYVFLKLEQQTQYTPYPVQIMLATENCLQQEHAVFCHFVCIYMGFQLQIKQLFWQLCRELPEDCYAEID